MIRCAIRNGLLSAALIILAACGSQDSIPAAGVIQLSEVFTGKYSLSDTQGNPVTDKSFHGDVAVIYFGFASCPDVCPLALGSLSAALNMLDEKTLGGIRPVFITVDPDRDDPQRMADFLAFDERFIGLTGDNTSLKAARESFKVYAERENLDGSALGYIVNHTSLFYIVDRNGTPRVALRDTMTPEEIAAFLRRAAAWK